MNCNAPDALVEKSDENAENSEKTRPKSRRAKVASEVSTAEVRKISTGRPAWDRALGGGFVRPSSLLIKGPRGAGKSTSALRLACHVATTHKRAVLYASAEMPARHVRRLCDSLGISKGVLERLYIQESPDLDDVLLDIEELSPIVVVWDSIQRFKVDESLGDVELREVVVSAVESAHANGHIALLLSQVTKELDFFGASSIGHDVDTIIDVRKIAENRIRVEVADKNRFAPTPLFGEENLYDESAT